MDTLDNLNVPYIYQKEEYDNIHNRKFIFDFYLNLNGIIYIIEYNGRQHYMPIEYLGGEIRYKEQIVRDNNLKDYCKIKNYNLLEIKYDVKNEDFKHLINKFINGNT